jgi:NADH-quinone oxidoreductase subunit M
MRRIGGLWSTVPRLAAIGMFFAVASLGMPGLGNFVGEFLILFGSYRVAGGFAAAATIGLVAATVYALIFVQRVFHGEGGRTSTVVDFSARHMIVMSVMIATLIWFGVYPQPVFDTASPGLDNLQRMRLERLDRLQAAR